MIPDCPRMLSYILPYAEDILTVFIFIRDLIHCFLDHEYTESSDIALFC